MSSTFKQFFISISFYNIQMRKIMRNQKKNYYELPFPKSKSQKFLLGERQEYNSPQTYRRQEISPMQERNLQQSYHEYEKEEDTYKSEYRLERIKSTECKRYNEKEYYENLIELYRNQNKNLKRQNKFLTNEIQKHQVKMERMANYIEEMRKQTKKMEQKYYRHEALYPQVQSHKQIISEYLDEENLKSEEEEQKINSQFCPTSKKLLNCQELTSYNSKHSCSQNGNCMMEAYNIGENQLILLEKTFKALLQESSRQSDLRKKRTIRKKLAETAEQIKIINKQMKLHLKK